MKRLPMLLLVAAPYVFIALVRMCFLNDTANYIPLIWAALFILVMLPNMIYAFILPRFNYNGQQILFWGMLLKLLNIPVYCAGVMLVLLLNVFVIPLLPFLLLFNYILLISTSMYCISGILKCRREGKLSKTEGIINIILQLLFCTDVFSAAYCYIKAKMNYRRIN